MLLFTLLVTAHLVADFPLQPDAMAAGKATRPWYRGSLPVHVGVHFGVIAACLAAYTVAGEWLVRSGSGSAFGGAVAGGLLAPADFAVGGAVAGGLHILADIGGVVGVAVGIALCHGGIDSAKVMLERHLVRGSGQGAPAPSTFRLARLGMFGIDQVGHMSTLAVAARILHSFGTPSLAGPHLPIPAIHLEQAFMLVSLFICATSVSSVIVTILTDPPPGPSDCATDLRRTVTEVRVPGQPATTEHRIETSFTPAPSPSVPRGQLIGSLERLVVVVVICMDAYSLIPVIVAAKSLARFRKFDNQAWAEYFLVGTLSSILCGAVTGLAARAVLGMAAMPG